MLFFPFRELTRLRRWNDDAPSKNWSVTLGGAQSSHIDNILNGKTKKPTRETLIQLGIGYDKRFEEIDNLLRYFGQDELDDSDFRILEKISRKRKYNTLITPIYPGALSFAISILSIELMPGNVQLVTNGYPHVAIKEDIDDYSYCSKVWCLKNNENKNHRKLNEKILKKRHSNIKKTLAKNKITHIVCKNCFSSYYNEIDELGKKGILILIEFLKKYDNFNFFISNNCCRFEFHLKYATQEKDDMITIFAGKFSPETCEQLSGEKDIFLPITSFATANENIFKIFQKEFDRLKNDLFIDNKKDCIDYLNSLINK